MTHNKRETQMNNQQVELKEQLTQLIKQESFKEMLQTTMINTLTQIFSTVTLQNAIKISRIHGQEDQMNKKLQKY